MKTLHLVGRASAVLVLCLSMFACADKRLSKENFAKVKDGMSLEQVNDILGRGEKETGGDGGAGVAAAVGVNVGGAKGAGGAEMYKWGNDEKYIRIGFRQNKVVFKDMRGF